ncbi:MAG: glycosyltransferase [Sarcina sp.]|nr:glycosyltransferase [Sarcina sp.]
MEKQKPKIDAEKNLHRRAAPVQVLFCESFVKNRQQAFRFKLVLRLIPDTGWRKGCEPIHEEVIHVHQTNIALIPAFEPDRILLEIAEELKRMDLEVLVVDDGSGPGFSEIFEEMEKEAVVLHHDSNRGKGAALKTGLKYIRDRYTEPYAVVTVDADGQHRTADVMRILLAVPAAEDSLILGSRRFTGKVPLRSRLGNVLTRLVYRAAAGVRVYDTQTGLRAFSHKLVDRLLEIDGDRYEYEMNVLMAFAKDRRTIREIPIETVYLDGNTSSHFDVLRDSFRIYREILKFSVSSFAGFLTDFAMYCFLLALTGNLVLSNIAARLVSAAVNYTLNRKFVFQSGAPVGRSVTQYAALAAAILAGNTIFLKGLSSLGWNSYAAKIMTEIIFFALSWVMQKHVIFRRKEVYYEKA